MQSLFISLGLTIVLFLPTIRSNNCTVPLVYHGNMKKEVIGEPYFHFLSFSWKSDVYHQEIPSETVLPPASSLHLFCHNGYSFQGTKEGREKVTCTRGKWQPAPVCLRIGHRYKPPITATQKPVTLATSRPARVSVSESVAEKTAAEATLSIPVSETTTGRILDEVPPVDASVSHFQKRSLQESCSCKYPIDDENVIAHADGRKLKFPYLVRNGSIVTFRCRHVGFHVFKGAKEMKCEGCRNWHSDELPTCAEPNTGSAAILYDKAFNVSMEGNLEANLGQAINLVCAAVESPEYPKWTFPTENGVTITLERLERESYNDVLYVSKLEIENADFEHEGSYDCAVGNGPKNAVEIVIIDPDITCPRFPNSSEINVSYERERRVGSRAFFSCKQLHHQLNGLADVACLNNAEWSGDFPQCTVIKCKKFQENELLSIFYTNDGIVDSRAIFHCLSARKRSGVAFAICLENGMWSDPAPSCLYPDITCPRFPNSNEIHVSYERKRRVGSRAFFSCKQPNQQLNGRADVECLRNGEWSESLPQCTDTKCKKFEENDLLSIFYTNDRIVGSRATFDCASPGKRSGVAFATCLENGMWSDPAPSCLLHACPDLPIPIAGSVKYLSVQQRSATFRARNTSRVSGRSGVFEAIHRSQNISARALETSTAEPYVISLHPGSHPVGSKAVIKCESKYYQLFGSRTRRCKETGKWSGRHSICLPVCGRSESTRSPFIMNGKATDIGQWPWQAGIALDDYEGWTMKCGASLLNELWVITAAHCVTYQNTAFTIEPDEFQVYLGKYHRNDTKDDQYVQIRKIQEIHPHPDYNPRTYDADIALIQLDLPVELTYRVQPICLPTERTTRINLVEGQKGIVTGWGVNENSTLSETLRQAVLPVVSHANCEKGLEDAGYRVTITDNMFCAGYKGGSTDTCYGDSGGPVVFADECTKAAKWVLEGIISWGIGCGFQNQYGGYTAVSKFLDWIHLYV